eukprot:366406-Chlamydomonas_euryale.AAC.38
MDHCNFAHCAPTRGLSEPLRAATAAVSADIGIGTSQRATISVPRFNHARVQRSRALGKKRCATHGRCVSGRPMAALRGEVEEVEADEAGALLRRPEGGSPSDDG